eukprot:TRINITY_DN6357_c0_g1_i1.p1 TRINITY_DN6357_c0_g1~~TRINITY_DN6357_c0_g1_i1.p1  ORF type:complete len:390 (+),score=80.91 TRINITY_DN6357_c0_g1_i1:55-1224(+)
METHAPPTDQQTRNARTVRRTVGNSRVSITSLVPMMGAKAAGAEGNEPPEPTLTAEISCIDFGSENFTNDTNIKSMRAKILLQGRPPWAKVRWINVDGVDDYVIKTLAGRYNIHPLVVADLLVTSTRPKIDIFENESQVFIVSKMVTLSSETMKLEIEQTSFFLDAERCTVITFQEGRPGDVWEELRKRLTKSTAKIRQSGADHLLYGLMEAIPRTCYPIINRISDRIETLETQILDNPTAEMNTEVYTLKRELLTLRRSVRPMREVISHIISDDMPSDIISAESKMFFKDICDELDQINDMVDTQTETATGLNQMYDDIQRQNTNQAMYVLTIISVIFIPLTFVAGVYGMNYETLPELRWKFGYLYVWSIFIGIASALLYVFRHFNFI